MLWRLIKWVVVIGFVLSPVVAVWAVAAVSADSPVEYSEITEHFKYGSIGSEPNDGLPILVFNFKRDGNIERAIAGHPIGTLVGE